MKSPPEAPLQQPIFTLPQSQSQPQPQPIQNVPGRVNIPPAFSHLAVNSTPADPVPGSNAGLQNASYPMSLTTTQNAGNSGTGAAAFATPLEPAQQQNPTPGRLGTSQAFQHGPVATPQQAASTVVQPQNVFNQGVVAPGHAPSAPTESQVRIPGKISVPPAFLVEGFVTRRPAVNPVVQPQNTLPPSSVAAPQNAFNQGVVAPRHAPSAPTESQVRIPGKISVPPAFLVEGFVTRRPAVNPVVQPQNTLPPSSVAAPQNAFNQGVVAPRHAPSAPTKPQAHVPGGLVPPATLPVETVESRSSTTTSAPRRNTAQVNARPALRHSSLEVPPPNMGASTGMATNSRNPIGMQPRAQNLAASPSLIVWPNTPLKPAQPPTGVTTVGQPSAHQQPSEPIHLSTTASPQQTGNPMPARAPMPFVWRPAPPLPTNEVLSRPASTNRADFGELKELYQSLNGHRTGKIEFRFAEGLGSILPAGNELIIRGNVTGPTGNPNAEPDTINLGPSGLRSMRGDSQGPLTPEQQTTLINAAKSMLEDGFDRGTAFRVSPTGT